MKIQKHFHAHLGRRTTYGFRHLLSLDCKGYYILSVLVCQVFFCDGIYFSLLSVVPG